MLEIKSVEKNYGINFPTSLIEFTPEILKGITEDIGVSKYRAIIMLAYEVNLFKFATSIRGNKENTNAKVIPILAKINAADAEQYNYNVGDKVIIDKSTIERGVHLNIPIMIASQNATQYLIDDEKLMVNIIKGKEKDATVTDPIVQTMIDNKHNSIFIVEFKIIPVGDITSTVPISSKVIDPFKTKSIKLDKELVN